MIVLVADVDGGRTRALEEQICTGGVDSNSILWQGLGLRSQGDGCGSASQRDKINGHTCWYPNGQILENRKAYHGGK